MNKQVKQFMWGMAALLATANAEAAVCTTNAGAGTWGTAATWSCGHVPLSTDTVVISRAITLSANSTIAGLTVNAGVTFSGNNRNLIVGGPVLISGTYDTGGGDLTTTGGGALTIDAGGNFNFTNGNTSISGNVVVNGTLTSGGDAIQMTGASTTVSGTGTIDNTDFEIDALGVSLPAGSTLAFSNGAQLRVGNNNTASFTLDGTITGFGMVAGDRIMRVYQNSVMMINGTINAPNAYIRIEQNASITNNGTVSVQYLRTDAVTAVWTQGNNSNLTLSVTAPVGNWNGVLNASATGNTVTYNGTSTPLTPSSSYYNLAGTAVTCPHGFTVTGSDPCTAGGPLTVTKSPGSCVSMPVVSVLGWTNPARAVSSNNSYATRSLNDLNVSDYLQCTNYGFAIPAGATINGITVKVERKASNTGIQDAAMRLVKNVAGVATIQATNRSTTTAYTTVDVIEPHGGAADLWGDTWTIADINTTNFGAAFAAKKPGTAGGARTVSVDHISITVTYTPAPTTPDHVSISAPTTAMALAETPVTIAPHTAAHAAMTAAGTISLSTSTGTGDWTIGTGTGTLTPGAANSGLATYTFGAAESSATLGFTAQTAETVTLNVAYGAANMLTNTPVGEKANTITFSAASFVFTSSACTHNVAFGTVGQCALVTWSPRTAGQALGNIYITSVNASGVPTRLHPVQIRTRDMQFGLSCHDPIANAGISATFSAAAAALPLCQGSGATPTSWTTAATLSFPGGSPSVGPYSFNYDDVGKMDLWMRNSAVTSELGSSGIFVVKPAGFTLSSIQRSSDNFANPGAADASGTAFVKAGEAFMVTVTAVNASGVATPNYGKETAPESVKLTPALVVGLGLSNNPAISGSFGAFANGVATGAGFNWDEVGIITLTPSVGDTDYLGAGDVTGTTSGNVGRFSLGKFVLQGVSFDERADLCQSGVLVSDGVTACASTFSYTGEQINARFTLVPNSLNGVDVLNYVDSATAANDFAKLDPTTFAGLNLGAVDRVSAGFPHYLTARISNSGMPVATCATALCFQTGTAAVTVPFMLSRSASTHVVYGTADIGIAPVDSDGARVEGLGATAGLCNNPNASDCYDLDVDASAGNDRAQLGTTEFRHGRSHLDNAVGSELLALAMPVRLEYWDGTRYVASADDNLSLLTLALDNYLGNLASGETTLTAPVFASGVGRVGLSAPGAGNSGSVDVIVTAPSYLPGDTARGTFGVYKGNKAFIYLRESY